MPSCLAIHNSIISIAFFASKAVADTPIAFASILEFYQSHQDYKKLRMFRSYTEISRTMTMKRVVTDAPKTSYSCELCGETNWLSETDVELHRKESHFDLIRQQMDQTERFCTVCMKLQENHSSLLSHLKTRHLLSSPNARRIEREIFICDYCNHLFFNKEILIAHMYSHMYNVKERKKKIIPCPKCRKNIHLKSIWFHFQQHEIPSLSLCDICLKSCENIKELGEHLKSHRMYYKCEMCDYQTSQDTRFENHLDEHANTQYNSKVIDRKVLKNIFNQSTTNVRKYQIHHSYKGLDLPKLMRICVLCREICTDLVEMQKHVVRDHLSAAAAARAAPCACRCGLQFSARFLLKHHVFRAGPGHGHVADTATALRPQSVPQIDARATHSSEDLTVIYAEIDEDNLVTIEAREADNSNESFQM